MAESGEPVEIKVAYFLNEIEGDLIGYEAGSGEHFEEPEYRNVESFEQLRQVFALTHNNLILIEENCDLKNALEMCHVVVSFRVGESESHFIFLPVFGKNFKNSEVYSNWVEVKNLLKQNGGGSPTRTSLFTRWLLRVYGASKLSIIAFVESQSDKYAQSMIVLEEVTKAVAGSDDLRQTRSRRSDESMQGSRPQSEHSSNINEQLDNYAKQVIQESNELILRTEEMLVE